MRDLLTFRKKREAQTAIFFLLAFGLICLLCGLAIDSGLLYLASARLSRAVDGAALQAVGNASQSTSSVATIMRNFAIANYTDLQTISINPAVSNTTYTVPGTGATEPEITYLFADGTAGKDSSGNYRRYVQVIFQLGSGNQITAALCNARCPVTTYFMGYADGVLGGFTGVSAFKDLKVSSSAVATRNPRLIMVVVDRSGSMLFQGGGAYGLPAAVVTFLNFFDTSSDYIGLVSFSSAARLEMPLTTNFLNAGTNALYDTYQVETNVNPNVGIPGVDPEERNNVQNYTAGTGNPPPPRRMKFGGQTAADEGLRLAMEQLMANSGFTNPNVVKYIVLFTDGAWNTVRTMVASPGYTNVVPYPAAVPIAGHDSIVLTPSVIASYGASVINSIFTNYYIPVPTLSPWLSYSNSVGYVPPSGSANGFDYQNHTNDVWQSTDGKNEPLSSLSTLAGTTLTVNNSTNYLGTLPSTDNPNNDGKSLDVFTSFLNVWVPPGAVDYVYGSSATPVATYVSDYTNPAETNLISLSPGQSNVLVVPGYLMEGIISDSLDLAYPDNPSNGGTTYPRYRDDGYNEAFMWPDDTTSTASVSAIQNYTKTSSWERAYMFRNYANLLTGYYVMRPDDPLGPSTDTNPFITDQTWVLPLNANGPYYPSAAFYWPFDLVGIDQYQSFGLINPTSDADLTGQGLDRFIAYSINMLSPAASPEYAGELFYLGSGGTGALSGTSSASSQLTSSTQWETGVPSWALAFSGLMLTDGTHNSAIGGATWRPASFNGSTNASGACAPMAHTTDANLTSEVNLNDSSNKTGGYVSDGHGNIYRNAMSYSGRPTHYFDFSTSQWKAIPDNHTTASNIALALGNWKAQEYAWHARQAGVTIFTVGYGTSVDAAECGLLADVANAVNIVSPAGQDTNGNVITATNANNYITGQPVGQQFYANTPADISNDFYQVGTAISGALTQ
jgi:Flp pilus assembly protein TadG